MKKNGNINNLQKFKTYQLIMDGIQGRTNLHQKIMNLPVPSIRIHSNTNQDLSFQHKKKKEFPELRLKEYGGKMVTQPIEISRKQSTNAFIEQVNADSLKINSKVRRALSIQCKKNFVQFLMVQKAGQVGDISLYQKLNESSQKHKTFSPAPKIDKKSVQYLQLDEENQQQIIQQVRTVLRQNQQRQDIRQSTPLDEFIRNVHESKSIKLPQIKTQKQAWISCMNDFNI